MGPDFDQILKFQKSSKKYWNMTEDLHWPFWNNINPQKTRKYKKQLRKNQKSPKLFSPTTYYIVPSIYHSPFG